MTGVSVHRVHTTMHRLSVLQVSTLTTVGPALPYMHAVLWCLHTQ